MREHTPFVIFLTALLVFAVCGIYQAHCADEITVTTYLKVSNGDYSQTRNVNQLKVDQTGNSASLNIQSIQTNAYELLVIASDVVSNGYAFFRNVTTNTDRWIDVGATAVIGTTTNFIPIARFKAGYPSIVPLHPTQKLYAIGGSITTDVTGINLEHWVNEE